MRHRHACDAVIFNLIIGHSFKNQELGIFKVCYPLEGRIH